MTQWLSSGFKALLSITSTTLQTSRETGRVGHNIKTSQSEVSHFEKLSECSKHSK